VQSVDVLVNNAGITRDARIVKMTEEQFLEVIRVNLGAAYELTMALNDHFAAGASVVSLSSRAYLGNFGQFNYSASKGGLVGMTRALALELAPHAIRVNAVAPTFVRTDLTAPIFRNPDILKVVMSHTPLGVLPEVGDIAASIVFLAGPAARCITGVTLPVDSGYLAR